MPSSSLLVVALATVVGCAAAAAPGPAVLAALPAVLTLLWRGRWRLGLVAVVCFAIAWGRAGRSVAAFEQRRASVRDELGAPSRCAGRGTVIESPTWVRDSLRMDVEFLELECEGRRLKGPLEVRLYGGPIRAGRGDEVAVVAQLGAVRMFRNVDVVDPIFHAARRGVVLSGGALAVETVREGWGWPRLVDRARARARDRIVATFAPGAAGLARALVLGENDLTDEDNDAFKRSGLAHLLAVSGTHLVFAVVVLVNALAFLLVRIEPLAVRVDVRRVAAAVGVGLAIIYADFAGGSGSAWRAAWMLVAVFGLRAVGRHPQPDRALAASLLVGAALDPLVSFDISFALSAAATAGLLAVGVPVAARLRGLGPAPVRFVVLSIVATLSAMVPCVPLLALLGPSLNASGVLANVVAAPVGELAALPLCLVHALLGFWPSLERGVALAASGALLAVAKVAHTAASATWAAIPVPPPTGWHLAILAVGAGLAFSALTSSRRKAALVIGLASAAGVLAVECAVRSSGAPMGRLRVTFIDVGQGDAALVDLPDGRVMLVDGGGFAVSPVDPGRLAVLPLLRARRRSDIDVAVLTHPHPDHFLGLASVLERLGADEVWTSMVTADDGAGPELMQWLERLKRRGTRVLGPGQLCGRPRWFGGAAIRVLGPCPAADPTRGANDNSLVLRIGFDKRAVLLAGDAERAAEADLLKDQSRLLHADVLKAGHHGSRTSTGARFLAAVAPEMVVISSGVRNRFGHPHPETLRVLREAGVPWLRTDRLGAVVWQTDGRQVRVRTYATER